MKNKPLPLAVFALLALPLAACSSPAASDPSPTAAAEPSAGASSPAPASALDDCEGIGLYIDGTALDGGEEAACVPAEGAVPASDLLAEAGVTTEGTVEYGDQVICRVNGLPAADQVIPAEDGSDYVETCQSMPAAFAYWSLWVKPADGEWAYAQEGLSTLRVQPGETVGLLFTLNGEPAEPRA